VVVHGLATERARNASYDENTVRKLIQFVLIIALMLSGDALSGAVMPCCAQSPVAGMRAGMEMPPVASTAAVCHDDAMTTAPASSMHMQAAMLQCPRTAANVQVSSQWTTSEQAEIHSPLQIASHLSLDSVALRPDTSRFTRVSPPAFPDQNDLSSSLPLRI
jgi:hypothetical protein